MGEHEIYHHGILGQKWGVRRYQNADGTRTEAGKKRERESNSTISDDYKKAHSSESVSELSDNELRSRINRLQLEQQYSKISNNSINIGKEVVSNISGTVMSVAALTTAALTIYNNSDKIKNIVSGIASKVPSSSLHWVKGIKTFKG